MIPSAHVPAWPPRTPRPAWPDAVTVGAAASTANGLSSGGGGLYRLARRKQQNSRKITFSYELVMGEVMRHVKDVKLGDHLCLAFSHEDEQREVASAFVARGLERRERVVYFAGGPADERVRRRLEIRTDQPGTQVRLHLSRT